MKKLVIGFIVLLILGLTGGLGYYFYEQNQKSPIVYKTVKPKTDTIIKKAVATGAIVPKKEVAVKPLVSGILDKLYFEPGQQVKRGQTLAKIKVIPNMSTLSNAQAAVKRAKINKKNTEKELKRQKDLFDQGVISEQDYLQFQLSYDLAVQDVDAAQENLRIIKEGQPSNAGNTTTLVKATVSGMILDMPMKEGASVIESNTFNEGTTIALIANMNDMIFEGKVDESEVGKLRKGMDLKLTVGAIDKETFDAKLDFIAPKGVEEEGAIKFDIKAEVRLKENQFIRAGYSANADIVLERRDSVLTINESYLEFKDDSVFAFIQVDSQKFEKKPIKVGLSDGIKVEIIEGLVAETAIRGDQKKEGEDKKMKH